MQNRTESRVSGVAGGDRKLGSFPKSCCLNVCFNKDHRDPTEWEVRLGKIRNVVLVGRNHYKNKNKNKDKIC